MQIHELTQQRLDEQGILQGIKSAAQSFNQERQSQVQQKALDAVLKKAVPAWNKYTQQLKNMTPDPQRYQQLYKQALTAFVQKNLMGGQQLNSAINRQEILKIIDSITVAADNPTEVNQRFRMLVQQAGLAQPDVEKTSTLIRVISIEPAIVQYRNKDYVVGDRGTWVEKQTGKETPETFGQFLDQEWAKVAPESPVRTVPGQSQDVGTVLQQAGIDTAKLAQIQAAIKADPAVADQLRKTLGL